LYAGEPTYTQLYILRLLAQLVELNEPPPYFPQMPTFFFNVRDGKKVFSDEDGAEFVDIKAAEVEAAEAAMAIGRELLPDRKGGEPLVEVLNQQREIVLTVNVELRIARHAQRS
jgi:hypothetical protein